MNTRTLRPAARRVVALSLIALSLSAGASAAAVPQNSEPSTKVRVSDLNLNSDAGIDTLYRRIKSAARRVCNDSVTTGDPKSVRHWWRCYDEAIARAVEQIGNARLAALHAQKHGARQPG